MLGNAKHAKSQGEMVRRSAPSLHIISRSTPTPDEIVAIAKSLPARPKSIKMLIRVQVAAYSGSFTCKSGAQTVTPNKHLRLESAPLTVLSFPAAQLGLRSHNNMTPAGIHDRDGSCIRIIRAYLTGVTMGTPDNPNNPPASQNSACGPCSYSNS